MSTTPMVFLKARKSPGHRLVGSAGSCLRTMERPAGHATLEIVSITSNLSPVGGVDCVGVSRRSSARTRQDADRKPRVRLISLLVLFLATWVPMEHSIFRVIFFRPFLSRLMTLPNLLPESQCLHIGKTNRNPSVTPADSNVAAGHGAHNTWSCVCLSLGRVGQTLYEFADITCSVSINKSIAATEILLWEPPPPGPLQLI